MRRLVLAIFILLATAGCAAAGTTPSATAPQMPAATKACGGFHLVLDNVGQADIEVRINGALVTTVTSRENANISRLSNRNVPNMPWNVRITRVTDGATLLAVQLTDDGTDGRHFQVGDAPIAQATGGAYIC